MIRVLIAEDSATTRELLVMILRSDPEIEVVGEAKHGLEAIEMTKRLRPDVITMDIQMPRMNGFDATKRIMMETPTPIVIVSGSVDVRQVEVSMNALRLGAVALLPKPEGPASEKFEADRRQFVATIKSMSQVKVVRQWGERRAQLPPLSSRREVKPRLVAIAASTGGPAALERILADLPGDLVAPVVVVQHMANGFLEGFVSWLNASSLLTVKLAVDGEPLLPATVYIAPDDRHIGVTKSARIALSTAPPMGGFRPSATHLFESAAQNYGASALAVILTGMGRDGVDGLRAIRSAGGYIVAQDEATSVVFGMPAAAIEEKLPDAVLPLSDIASRLITLIDTKESRV